jgi:hypothetical protein
MCKLIKNWWSKLWSKTTVDEKAIAKAKEIKKRTKAVLDEVNDVGAAIKEVANQVGDIADAAKGKARKGRKKKSDKVK